MYSVRAPSVKSVNAPAVAGFGGSKYGRYMAGIWQVYGRYMHLSRGKPFWKTT